MTTTKLYEIYKNKRVLVTGHTGFKGSWLAIWLKELGADVVGYALEPDTQPNNYMACNLGAHINHIIGDVRDLDHLKKIFQEYKPEFVFHLAAQAIVRRSYSEPKMTFDTNVGGTINILEAIRLNPTVRAFVNVTSDKCYENREWLWGYRECDPMGGNDPYSASKGCAELVFNAYLKSFFVGTQTGIASVRAGNVIGGGDWAEDRLIPDCVRALVQDKPVGVRNPGAIRPWQHVLEPIAGYLWLGTLIHENPEFHRGSWNFGPNDSDHLRVGDVVGKFIEQWGSGKWLDTSTPDSPHEAFTLRLCCDKAHTYLKWHNTLNIEQCLNMTADWYKSFYAGNENMYDVCTQQIRTYTKQARVQKLAWSV